MPLIQPEARPRFRSALAATWRAQNKKGELEALQHASGDAGLA